MPPAGPQPSTPSSADTHFPTLLRMPASQPPLGPEWRLWPGVGLSPSPAQAPQPPRAERHTSLRGLVGRMGTLGISEAVLLSMERPRLTVWRQGYSRDTAHLPHSLAVPLQCLGGGI